MTEVKKTRKENEIKKEAITKAADTVVQCPYCRELHSVSSGWFFADNPDAKRDDNKIGATYITKQLGKYLEETIKQA